MALTPQDEALLEAATRIIASRYKEGWHKVGASLRTRSGKSYAAVHLGATVKRVAVCAEAIAIGMAVADGDADIETIVAVDKNGNVVSPCGMCREMIADYSPEASVIVPDSTGNPTVVRVGELLPNKFKKTW